MKQLAQLEAKLEVAFKDLPKIPKSGKDGIIGVMPYLALIFGALQVVSAYWVWRIIQNYDRVADVFNQYSSFYVKEVADLGSFDRGIIYLGALVVLVSGVIGILAYKPLLNKERRGWDLLFLASVVNVVYSVIAVFIQGRGIGSLVFGLLGSAIGFYILFQIKEAYTKKSAQ